jgi:choline dehydrogenase-like flavoprotein
MTCPASWMPSNGPSDLASVWDWAFEAQPNPHLNGRVVSMSMGKVLGGGSSINAMIWARGHQNDWDYFAAEAGDSAWNYEAVVDGNLKVYGIQNLRIADASIMPRAATGNTMATCVISHHRRTSERDPAEAT